MNINETIQINNQLALLIENEELDDDTIRDTYEFIKSEIENNSNNLVAYYKELDADIEKNKNMSKAYAEYAKRLEKRKENVKKTLTYFMHATNTPIIKTDYAKISFRKSTAVNIYEPSLLPKDCILIKEEPSKSMIKKMLEAGKEVQGAKLIENENLQIRWGDHSPLDWRKDEF